MRLVLASRNGHKLREFARLLDGIDLEPLAAGIELPPETGDSFEANARLKAHAAAAAGGEWVIADDSGIEAEALGGAPGIYSARYAGPGATDAENLAKLRANVPPGSALRYVCAVVVAGPAGAEHVVVGTCTGTMAPEPRGAGGFGYDPVFVPDDGDGTRAMAELSDAEKDAISHRGRAARALMPWLAGRR